MRIAVLVVLVFATSIASAEPPSLTPLTQPRPHADKKDRNVAIALSVLGTGVAPIAAVAGVRSNSGGGLLLGVSGMMLLPSVGHWYAGEALTTGLGIRMAGLALMSIVVMRAVSCEDECSSGDDRTIETLGYASLGLLATGAIWDIATAGTAVDDWNRAHGVSVTPTAMKLHGGGYAFGLSGRF